MSGLMRVRYKLPFRLRLLRWLWPVVQMGIRLLVPLYAIRGRYPWWMLTPDDPVSPFGSGTTPTASREGSQMAVYRRLGRYAGDVVWLAWRNCGYGLNYTLKPAWLKNEKIRYEDLHVDYELLSYSRRRFWLAQPDGTWLWETQREFGPFIMLTGFRIEPIFNGARENALRASRGEERAPRPAFHPNLDGRPIFSFRTARTM